MQSHVAEGTWREDNMNMRTAQFNKAKQISVARRLFTNSDFVQYSLGNSDFKECYNISSLLLHREKI